MKMILVAFMTFGIGFLAFNFFHSKPGLVDKIPLADETTEIIFANIPVSENSESSDGKLSLFFNSFEKDSGYSGWFIADDFTGMKDVWAIDLLRDGSKTGKMHWSATVMTDEFLDPETAVLFDSVSIKTKGDKLSFVTEKIRGVSYTFEGEIFVKDNAEKQESFKGRLRKYVKGKKVAELKSDFDYFEPQCWH